MAEVSSTQNDWCHICGHRVALLANVDYPTNAEHASETTEYIRICVDCAELIRRVGRGEHAKKQIVWGKYTVGDARATPSNENATLSPETPSPEAPSEEEPFLQLPFLIHNLVEENGKTILENNLAKVHQIPIGALVEVKYANYFGESAGEKVHARLYVVRHDRDCDGTPLYTVARRPPQAWEITENTYERWLAERSAFTPLSLLVHMLYNPDSGFREARLKVVPETEETKKGAELPQWDDDEIWEDELPQPESEP